MTAAKNEKLVSKMLNQNNYYDDKYYFSSSEFRSYRKCEAAALHFVKEQTTAMLKGSYLDAMVEGRQAEFEDKNRSTLFKKNGELYAEFLPLPDVWEFLQKDSFFMDYLQGDKQTILTGVIAGVPFKAKLDICHDERIVDFKTASEFSKHWDSELNQYVNFAQFWRYDIQAAIYQELEYQRTGIRKPFYLAVVTLKGTPNHEILHIPDETLRFALDEVELFAPKFQAIKQGFLKAERCEQCNYCLQTKRLSAVKNWLEV